MANRESLERSSSETSALPLQADDQDQVAPQSDLPADPLPMPSSTIMDESSRAYDSVVQSDIGVNTLLLRLKQSIASVRDYAAFLKKRSLLEEEHAQGLKKLCKSAHETIRRPENRQGSYAHNFEEVTRIHDRMADNGSKFYLSLHQMHEDLQELAVEKERGRKQWKQSGLNAEKRVQDAEVAMDKAKSKYDSLAEDYDRARTGDKQSGRVFGLKGPKSAAQVEEDLNRKVQGADADYAQKVKTAQSIRQELVITLRPLTVRAIQDLINECDSGLTLQMQKFASFNEKLLLSNGLCVSPLKGSSSGSNPESRSLRDVVYQIDNAQDLRNYVTSFASKVGPEHTEIKYERHHTLQTPQQIISPPSLGNRQQQLQSSQQPHPPKLMQDNSVQSSPAPNTTFGQAPLSSYSPTGNGGGNNASPRQQNFPQATAGAIPQIPPVQTPSLLYNPLPVQTVNSQSGRSGTDLPPLRPVFGVSLDELFKRDGLAVPMVVSQCLQAIDLFGLETEGIYRLSGTASHVAKLRSIFDNDSSSVDFRNPENFFHDVNSVAGLLKQFFRDLPDPLLTREHYIGFIEAAQIDDHTSRRDQLHAIINSLPDPNYATLRALTLHLNRVQERSEINRMTAGNLAICIGPTMMGSNAGQSIKDAGWQLRVIETILQNTYQIFDED